MNLKKVRCNYFFFLSVETWDLRLEPPQHILKTVLNMTNITKNTEHVAIASTAMTSSSRYWYKSRSRAAERM